MFPNLMRLYRRALILIVAAALLVFSLGAMATAQSPRLAAKTTVVSTANRSAIKLSTDFGAARGTNTYLYNTEVHDSTGKKVAQWVNTSWTNNGADVKESYSWDASKLADGVYTFAVGISKPNWAGLYGWNSAAGTIVVGATSWTTTATASFDTSGNGPISLDGHFASASNTNGTYALEMDVVKGGKKVTGWTQNTALSGTKSADIVHTLDPSSLASGDYSIALTVSLGATQMYTNASAGAFSIAPPVVTTTTTPPTTVPPTTTTVTPPTTVPASSSTNTALTDLPGWKLEYNQQFNTDAAQGQFLNTYKDFSAYGPNWKDTSGNGTYDPKIISVSGGDMIMNLHTEGSTHYVAAPEPKINNGSTDQLYGRYEVRFKADQIAGYKAAWLLWPQSNQWNDGEIDFPEGNLNGSIDAFSHYTGTPTSQTAFSSGANFGSWHTATTEWKPGSVSFYMDGKLIGTATKNIPTTAMHWVLQTETQLSGGAPSSTVSGNVYVDYVAAWAYTGS